MAIFDITPILKFATKFFLSATFSLVPILVVSAPAHAGGVCANAWFSRNIIAHRAGHCFVSNLGKAVFGNENCSPNGARFSALDKKIMAEISGMEQNWECEIDTTNRTLFIPEKALLEKLDIMPIRDNTESGCLGYLGEDVPLLSAPNAGAKTVGSIMKGMNIGNSHLSRNGWDFHQVYDGDGVEYMGWTNANIWNNGCESYAG